MKRRDLLAHPQANGCSLLRVGGNHSWCVHSASAERSAVPSHNEVNNHLARKICRDLGIPEPTRFQHFGAADARKSPRAAELQRRAA